LMMGQIKNHLKKKETIKVKGRTKTVVFII